MSFQAYLVNCSGGQIELLKSVAIQIRALDGLILMATRQGTIIAAIDDSQVDRVRRVSGVTFVGGVTLDPRGEAARELSQVFAAHLAHQVR